MLEQPTRHADIASDLEKPAEEETGNAAPQRQQPCSEGFQLPGALWRTMFGCYAIFILAITAAAGGSGSARFVIAISALFMLVYFSTASILARLGQPDTRQTGAGRPLQTIYGPMSAGAVWVQVLSVPFGLVIFAISIAVIARLAKG